MIYFAADIHGSLRLPWLKRELDNYDLKPDDYLIILGDAGIIWDDKDSERIEYYNKLPLTTLFIDGNHENFPKLFTYPETYYNGAKVHKISNKIYHIMRGEILTIGDLKFFCFGGAFSDKRLHGVSDVPLYDEEMPNDDEIANAFINLEKANYRVDYILCHVQPTSFVEGLGIPMIPQASKLHDFLDVVKDRTTYKRWIFGHFHDDMEIDNYDLIYDRILKIDELI